MFKNGDKKSEGNGADAQTSAADSSETIK